MSQAIDGAFRGASAAIEHLVRTIVREELRQHLGPEGDHLINVRDAPMSAGKLRALIRSEVLRGFKHGKDTFVSASEFRAFIEGRPVVRPNQVPETPIDTSHDAEDEVMVSVGLVPRDPEKRRAFDLRLAQRRAEGGERAEALLRAEARRLELHEKYREDEARKARQARRKPK